MFNDNVLYNKFHQLLFSCRCLLFSSGCFCQIHNVTIEVAMSLIIIIIIIIIIKAIRPAR